ncbi:MAG: hypothetical protein GY871_04710 [Actinomycetales bacterium]|nr:hypothetical protein [Actinomycetales bacterium]
MKLTFASLDPVQEVEPAPTSWPHVCDGAIYDRGSCELRLVATEDFEWGQLGLEFDCDGPPEDHWLAWEFDALGTLEEILGVDNRVGSFLLEHGLAPGESFVVDLGYETWGRDWHEDHGTEVAILDVRPIGEGWDDTRAAVAWEAYLFRRTSPLLVMGGAEDECW